MNVVRLPDRGRRTDDQGQAIQAQQVRAWLQRVLAAGDGAGPFSVERLCRKAGTSPTNITRFLKDASTVPRLATLAKIAHAAGVPPPGSTMTTDPHAMVDVPIILPHVFRTHGVQQAIMASIDAVRAPSKYSACVAVKMTADTGNLVGVLLGDMVIVDADTHPETNDLVMVALDTGLAGIYRLLGTWLMPQSAGSLPALPLASNTVIGVARQVQRELR